MPAMRGLLALSFSTLALVGCDKGSTTPPDAAEGARYVVTRETPFFDGGCAQEGPNNGKLKKGTPFTLVGEREGCWNVRLDDEDETYIRPTHVRRE